MPAVVTVALVVVVTVLFPRAVARTLRAAASVGISALAEILRDLRASRTPYRKLVGLNRRPDQIGNPNQRWFGPKADGGTNSAHIDSDVPRCNIPG